MEWRSTGLPLKACVNTQKNNERFFFVFLVEHGKEYKYFTTFFCSKASWLFENENLFLFIVHNKTKRNNFLRCVRFTFFYLVDVAVAATAAVCCCFCCIFFVLHSPLALYVCVHTLYIAFFTYFHHYRNSSYIIIWFLSWCKCLSIQNTRL